MDDRDVVIEFADRARDAAVWFSLCVQESGRSAPGTLSALGDLVGAVEALKLATARWVTREPAAAAAADDRTASAGR